MNTIILDDNWDICLDAGGNISQDNGDYAIVQSVANACRAFTQDMFYNQDEGIPHFLVTFPNKPNTFIIADYLEKEAEKFDEVEKAEFTNISIENRVLYGDLELTLTSGESVYVEL